MDEASKRWGSCVEFSATTANTTSPGCRYFSPCERGTSLQLGGKIEETRTRFCAAIPASRRASSKDVSRSRCFPTPLVKKIRLGTMSLPNSFASRKSNRLGKSKSNTVICEVWMKNQKKFPWEANISLLCLRAESGSSDQRPRHGLWAVSRQKKAASN